MNFETAKIYIFKGNPNSTYLKSTNGNWLICNDNTQGYVAINDPDGKRKSILDKDAYPASKYRYPNKQAIYLKNSNGEWFISDINTNGFLKISDPTGDRTKFLNANAIEFTQLNLINKLDNSSQSAITNNVNLESLIEMAFSDNKFTDKEIEVLKLKAVASGYDKDEFDIILNAKLHMLKKEKATLTSNLQLMAKETIHDLLAIIVLIENEKQPKIKVQKKEYKELKNINSFFTNIATTFENDSIEVDAHNKIREWKIQKQRNILKQIKSFPLADNYTQLIEFLSYSVPHSITSGKLSAYDESYQASVINNDVLDKYGVSNDTELDFRILLRHYWKQKSIQLIQKGKRKFSDDEQKRSEIENFAKQLGMESENDDFISLFSK